MQIKNKNLNHVILAKIKNSKKKIVLCHGVFDLLHIGHIRYFEQAKGFGDILIVSLTSDNFVNKGPGRPFFKISDRIASISALQTVDFVTISNSATAVDVIKKIKPNIYFKGSDYINHKLDFTNAIKKEIAAVRKYGGEVKYGSTKMYSSSKVINQISDRSNYQKKIINKIKKKYSFEFIKNKILSCSKKIKILILGEMIVDHLIFCAALGKSGKESILNLENKYEKKILGGVGAIANHLSTFAIDIKVLTYLGEYNNNISFIKKNLKKNIKIDYFHKKKSPTIIKTKIVDVSNNAKILGIYDFNDSEINEKQKSFFYNMIKKNIEKYDSVIVSDYGHGLISPTIAKYLSKQKKVNVNTQLNSANIGYHTIGKYKNAHCAVINEVELRHELKDRYSDIKPLMKRLAKLLNIKILVITAGKKGSHCYYKNNFFYCPAFANTVVDKIGSGDTFMAFFVLTNKIFSNDIELSLFVASIATTQVLEGFANEKKVGLVTLLKSINYILK
jgi:rfaE bifunctional protein nucleotidyltransferase chain/domain